MSAAPDALNALTIKYIADMPKTCPYPLTVWLPYWDILESFRDADQHFVLKDISSLLRASSFVLM